MEALTSVGLFLFARFLLLLIFISQLVYLVETQLSSFDTKTEANWVCGDPWTAVGSAVPTLEITELYSTGVLKKASTAKAKAIETTLKEKN